jgi:hypothetical protein
MDEPTIRIGERVGFRGFHVRGSRLWSIGYGDYRWVPGENEAHCDRIGKPGKGRTVWVNDPMDPDALVERRIPAGDHGRIPSPNCECGFYAYKTEALARHRFGGGRVLLGRSARFGLGNFGTDAYEVIGKVTLWGRVIRGTDGYRAQFARVVGLVAPDEIQREIADVLDHYEVPALAPSANLATGYITKVLESPLRVRIRTVSDDLGWFLVGPDVELPEGVPEVAVQYEWRNDEAVLTSVVVITEVDA